MEVDGLAPVNAPATRERPSSASAEHTHRPMIPLGVAGDSSIHCPTPVVHALQGIADVSLSRRKRDNGIPQCISPNILVTGLFQLHA